MTVHSVNRTVKYRIVTSILHAQKGLNPVYILGTKYLTTRTDLQVKSKAANSKGFRLVRNVVDNCIYVRVKVVEILFWCNFTALKYIESQMSRYSGRIDR